ncbi:MAG: glycosyltransferase [Bacilli bacterium]|nr:glycosyltransferase [Bacilli bacterium]
MKKVSILTLHMGYGGIEKSAAAIANVLCEKYEVEIVCSYKLYEKPTFPLNKKVKVKYLIDSDLPSRLQEYKNLLKKFHFIRLNKALNKEYFSKKKSKQFIKDATQGLSMYRRRIETMKQYIKNSDADILISTRDIFNNLVGNYAKDGVVKIGWEHNHHHNNSKYAFKVVQSARKLDYFVLVSKELRDYYDNRLKRYKCKCVYIPNVIDKIPRYTSKLTNKKFISVGRLSEEKGYLDLLKIINKLKNDLPDWHLDIIGDGTEKDNLRRYIKINKLDDYVTLHGFRDKDYINDRLRESSIYLMTSYTESFGIVLIEAMSYGVPCIAFDSAEGAREIIRNGYNGYLVKDRDEDEYIRKCNKLVEDTELRKKLGTRAREDVKKYSIDVVKDEWFNLLKR